MIVRVSWHPGRLLLLGLVFVLLPSITRAQVEEGGLVQLPAPQVERLTIRHPQGSLSVRGWDNKEIHIRFLKRAPTAAMLDLLRVQVDVHDGQVRIRSGIEARGELRELPQPDAGIDLSIDAPREAQLDASTFGGQLAAQGFRNGVELHSNTGTIRVADITGPVKTSAGRGDQWLQSIQGEVNATGVHGDMEISGIDGPLLSAQVVQGQITARAIRSSVVRLHTALGTLLLYGLLVPGGHYELHVDEGDVRVTLLDRPDLHFSVEASGTQVQNLFHLDRGAKSAEDRVQGDFRGGGPVLRLTTFRGRVVLAR